jgi:DNA topoisomerase-1
VLREFYMPFEQTLAQARESMRNVKREEILTDITCPKCEQGKLAIKFGRNGEFLACTSYNKEGGPDSCDFTSDFHRDENGNIVLEAASSPETSDVMCHLCGKPMVLKKGRFGPFYGCSNYPECTGTRRIGKDGKPVPLPEPTGVTCPKCQEGEILKRRGRFGRPFYSCSRYPECDYATNDLAQVSEYVPGQEESQDVQASSNGKAGGKASGKAGGKSSTRVTKQSSKSKAAKAKQPASSSKSRSKPKNGQKQDADSTATTTDKPTSTPWNKGKGSATRAQEAEESHNAP